MINSKTGKRTALYLTITMLFSIFISVIHPTIVLAEDTEPGQEDQIQEEPIQEDPLQEDIVQEEPIQEDPVQEEPEYIEPEDEPRPLARDEKAGITRVYGDTGYDTSIEIANALKKELGVSAFKSIVLASGKNFPDALSASAFAARKLAPVILVPGGSAEKVTNYVRNNLIPGGTIYILGGAACGI